MNDLKKIYQRLQANYPEGDWEITLEGGRLSIRLERAQVVVEGGRAVFTEEGEPAQELQGVSDDDLYEAIETFLLYQQEGEDEFLSSEEVRDACNATYRAAAKGLRRRGRLVLILTAAAELLLLLSRTYLEAGLWVLVPLLSIPHAGLGRAGDSEKADLGPPMGVPPVREKPTRLGGTLLPQTNLRRPMPPLRPSPGGPRHSGNGG